MTERYFDERLQTWVTVYRPGTAKGAITASGFRGAKRGHWSTAADHGSPEKPKVRGWTGPSKRKRSGNRH